MHLNYGIKLFNNAIGNKFQWVVFLTGLVFSIPAIGQMEKDCTDRITDKSFISDGQDHEFIIRNNKPVKLNAVFYPQFKYKIVIYCIPKRIKVDFKLLDNKGAVLFSNANKDYIRSWEFQFSSIMNAVVEINLADAKIKEENIQIFIGYQTLKAQLIN